jgi:nucleosome binding factor SPN SPT16 subunit
MACITLAKSTNTITTVTTRNVFRGKRAVHYTKGATNVFGVLKSPTGFDLHLQYVDPITGWGRLWLIKDAVPVASVHASSRVVKHLNAIAQ